MGLRTPPGSGIVPQSATFDGGTVKFQYYNDGGPVDGGGSPSTFSVLVARQSSLRVIR
jgi:hypothetical protein